MTCRDIPEEDWKKAGERLVYVFSRGHGADNARDLAQETLRAVWERADYQFEKREDFMPVCLGFARLISQAGHRKAYRYSGGAVPDDLPSRSGESAEAVEQGILLQQILQQGKVNLRAEEFKLILEPPPAASLQEANRVRVARHRALQKLARILGLKPRKP
jgi:hypothetical protein